LVAFDAVRVGIIAGQKGCHRDPPD